MSSPLPRCRRARATALACACLVAAVAGVAGVALRGRPGPAAQVLMDGTHGLSGASAVAVDGPHVWVTNGPDSEGAPAGPGWVSELDAGSGRLIRKISGAGYGFDSPVAITASQGRVWVASSPGDGQGTARAGSLTELDARSGALIRRMSGAAYGFDDPVAVTVAGGRVWVLNSPADAAGSVSELDAATGRPERTIYRGIGSPTAVTSAAGRIWITNGCAARSGGFVTELDAASGRVIRLLARHRYGFGCPAGIAAANGRTWVANQTMAPAQGSVTVLRASDGRWLDTLSGGYGFDDPASITADGSALWVANSGMDSTGGSVTELRAADGRHLSTLSSGVSLLGVLDGSWIRFPAGHRYHFRNPDIVAAAGAHVWVGSHGPASITILKTG